MPSLTKTIVAVTLLALLTYTNPSMEAYEKFIHEQILQETRTQDDLTKFFGSLFGGFVSSLITNSTIRRDFIILSFYDTDFGGEQLKVVGILSNFFVISPLKSVQKYTSSLPLKEKEISSIEEEQVTVTKRNPNKIIDCVQFPYPTKQGIDSKDLSNLEKWAGRYPTQSFGNRKEPNFFAIPQIRKRLQHILSSADFKAITIEYGVEGPVELIDSFLFISRCKPHDCAENNASIAVGLRDGSILVILTQSPDTVSNSNTKRCFALNSSLEKLPENILKRFFNP
ncbi:MAG: DUF4359 domain-containing protein [Nitrosomonas sp.]|jgi:hypothetical protein|nr:DUF4359 domain-containing protein [Nitrosomonas sp.]MBP9100761.1 DUF4359 domain-containing protein [Nitrosomonas sp.]